MHRVWSTILRLVFLVVRVVVTGIGFIELVGGLFSFWGSADVRYFGNIIFGALLLWPFRRMRNLTLFHWYYRLLLLNTALFIIFTVLSLSTQVTALPGLVIDWQTYLLGNLSLIFNTVIVWKYGEYRMGTSTWSPLFSAKALFRLIITMVVLLVGVLSYTLVGKHETAAGTRWLWPNGVGVLLSFSATDNVSAAPLFTSDAFHQPYTLEYAGMGKTASMSAAMVRMTIPLTASGSATIVAAPGTSVTITYNPAHGLEHMMLQGEGESQIVADSNMRSVWLDTNDKFVHLSKWKDQWIASPMGPYDVWFQFGYMKAGDVFSHATYAQGDVLRVNISKMFVKPTPTTWLGYTLPLYRSRLPWKLTVG